MLSSLNFSYYHQKFGLYFWVKEKLIKLILVFLITLPLCFLLACIFFPQFSIDAEYLLKKKSASGFEAIASQKLLQEKGTDLLTIEPYFYARELKEVAIKESAYQIEPCFLNIQSRIYFGLKSFIFFLQKKVIEPPFIFSHLNYLGDEKVHFSIRALGDHFFEVAFQGQKIRVPKEEPINLGIIQFEVKKWEPQDFFWYHYQVLPMAKTKKKVMKKLKVRLEKNAKSTLVLEFLADERLAGKNFLETFLKKVEKRIEDDRMEVLSHEINALEEEKSKLIKKIEEDFSIDPILKERKQEILYEQKKKEIGLIEEAKKQKEKKSFFLHSANPVYAFIELANELKELEKQKLSLKKPSDHLDKKILATSIKSLHNQLLNTENAIKEIEAQIEDIHRVFVQKEYSSHIAYPHSPLLEKLFSEKKNLEIEKKHLALSEVIENKNQLEKVEEKIKKELERIEITLKKQLLEHEEKRNQLNDTIYQKIEEEIAFLQTKAINQLKIDIEVLSEQIYSSEKKLKQIEENFESLELARHLDFKKWHHYLDLCHEKKLIDDLLIKKQSEMRIDSYYGRVLSAVQDARFRNWNFHLFLVFLLALFSTFFYFLCLWVKTASLGFFASNQLLQKLGFRLLTKKEFMALKGKKLLMGRKKNPFFDSNQMTFTQEIEAKRMHSFDHVAVIKDKVSLEDLELLLQKKDQVIFLS